MSASIFQNGATVAEEGRVGSDMLSGEESWQTIARRGRDAQGRLEMLAGNRTKLEVAVEASGKRRELAADVETRVIGPVIAGNLGGTKLTRWSMKRSKDVTKSSRTTGREPQGTLWGTA